MFPKAVYPLNRDLIVSFDSGRVAIPDDVH